DAAGPLRSCASTLVELEGRAAASPKEALEQIAQSSATTAHDVQLITEARQRHALPPGAAAPALFHLIELAHAMWARAAQLK
ncbi:MAG TPA: hypothetical protein VFY34_07020, partial [Pyrinomonadaceae bacterium]|nr:hypothetical protein [Pyrinomonadaceae bacterium]